MEVAQRLVGQAELKKFRVDNGLSYRELAKRINEYLPEQMSISFAALYQWENGTNGIPYFTMHYLSRYAAGEIQQLGRELSLAILKHKREVKSQ